MWAWMIAWGSGDLNPLLTPWLPSWFRFNKVLEKLFRGFNPNWHDSMTKLLEICQPRIRDPQPRLHQFHFHQGRRWRFWIFFVRVSWADKWHIKPNQHLKVQVWVIVPTYLRKKLSCFFFLKTQNPRSYKNIPIPGENMSLTVCSVLCCSGGFCLNLI